MPRRPRGVTLHSKRRYNLGIELQRCADALHALAEYAQRTEGTAEARACLKEARAIATLAAEVQAKRIGMEAAHGALLQLEHQGRIGEAIRRRAAARPITVNVETVPANGNGAAKEGETPDGEP